MGNKMWTVRWVETNEVGREVRLKKGFDGRVEADNFETYLLEKTNLL